MKTFSILGFGWLGTALYKSIEKEYSLKISSSKAEKVEELKKEGYSAFLINDENIDKEFFQTDILFINIPPSKSSDYLLLLKNIYAEILEKTEVIFISSTSIYDKEDKEYFEDTQIIKSTNSLVFDAETFIKERTNLIFRCSGLMGYNRIAGKQSAGKNVNFPDASVNYVHQDDVINAVAFCLEKGIRGTYNLCSKMHPTKMDIYFHNAKKHNFDDPIFGYKKTKNRRVINSDKLRKLGFKYKYENPFLYQ